MVYDSLFSVAGAHFISQTHNPVHGSRRMSKAQARNDMSHYFPLVIAETLASGRENSFVILSSYKLSFLSFLCKYFHFFLGMCVCVGG